MDRLQLKNRTKTFAHRCVKLANSLPETRLGRHIQGQLIRCSTSVAVNYRAVLLAQSDAAFSAKLSIVVEETDECDFWMEFAVDEKLVAPEKANLLIAEAKELTAIFISSRKTIQQRLKQ